MNILEIATTGTEETQTNLTNSIQALMEARISYYNAKMKYEDTLAAAVASSSHLKNDHLRRDYMLTEHPELCVARATAYENEVKAQAAYDIAKIRFESLPTKDIPDPDDSPGPKPLIT